MQHIWNISLHTVYAKNMSNVLAVDIYMAEYMSRIYAAYTNICHIYAVCMQYICDICAIFSTGPSAAQDQTHFDYLTVTPSVHNFKQVSVSR